MRKILIKIISIWYKGNVGEIIDDWKWILGYTKKYKWGVLYYLILGLVNTTVGLVNAVVSKYLIDIITGYKSDKAVVLLVVMISSSLLSILLPNLTGRISTRIGIYIKNDIEADIFEKLIDADWLSISQFSNGDILNRFSNDVSGVSINAVNWIPTVIISIYHFITTFVIILHYDLFMAILAFANAPFMALISRIVLNKQRSYGIKLREVNSGIMTFQSETFYNLDTIKSFGVLDAYNNKLKKWQKKYKKTVLDQNLFSIKTNIFMNGVRSIISLIAFVYCLYRLWTKDITYGTMTLFLSQRNTLAGAFSSVVSLIPSMLNSSISAHRIRELVDLPKEVHIEKSKELEPYKDKGLVVCMDDVNYSYVKGNYVITDSDFIAKPGEIVALVGPSGEGKTTMIRLILGLIRPEDGNVTISAITGESIRANADTRHLFAYVPQGNSILSGTIAENMRLAKEDATDEDIIHALEIACAWDFVSKMENGINSKVGERGKGLSEGQAQRIAIARAILRDAPVLLLDEATSALDVETERKVLRSIIQKQPNKTCIVTTHRPSVLNMCERVYRVMATKVTQLSEAEASKMAMDF